MKYKKYQNEPKFNGVYSRNNLPRIKDGAYEINLNEHKSIGNHWIALYVNGDNGDNFDSYAVEYIPKEIKEFLSKNIKTNICRIRANDSIMSGYFCIGFINFVLKGKSLLGYTNLFFPNEFDKNDKIISKYFQLLKNYFMNRFCKRYLKHLKCM